MEGRLEEQFQNAMKGVREYADRPNVRVSSMIKTDFDAYRQLVGLGADALNPLRKLIGNEKEPRWYVLSAGCEILRNSGLKFEFPDEMRGNLAKMEQYLANYIDFL